MDDTIIIWGVVSLLIIVLFFVILIFLWTRKYKYIDNKDKEFIIFVIDMYVNYAKELNIHSDEQHEKIVKHLEYIKKRYFLTKSNNKNKKKNEKK